MAVTDIQAFAHLTEADVEALGREFDAIRRDIEQSRGETDAAYIARTIRIQRGLVAGGRVTLFASAYPPAWVAGTTMLGLAKIIENMELGHNVIHGQWDWMNDPEVHSSAWEWDTACPSDQWKHSHNFVHHKYTNVVGKDDDVGYGVLRVTRDQRWTPYYPGAAALQRGAGRLLPVRRRAARPQHRRDPQGPESRGTRRAASSSRSAARSGGRRSRTTSSSRC